MSSILTKTRRFVSRDRFFLLLFGLLLALIWSCSDSGTNTGGGGNGGGNPGRPPIDVPAFGTPQTFEIACWNIQRFPKDTTRNTTVHDVKEIINDLKIDLFTVEEIIDRNAFNALLDSLSDYSGKLANFSVSGGIITGFIYNTSVLTMLSDTVLFRNDYDFPRPAYLARFRASNNGAVFDFSAIVVHLKAFGDSTSRVRRKRAVEKLKNYIDNEIQDGTDPDFIVAGDWNDLLEDPDSLNVFKPFLDDSLDYRFLDLPFAGSPTEYSFLGSSNFRTLIDHILITKSIFNTYPGIETKVLKIDQSFSQYEGEVSDHRPVAAKIPAF